MMTNAQLPELPEWLRDLFPFRTRIAEIGSLKMSFVDEGPADASPLLLLHGNPTWSFLFRDLIRKAMPDRRVIAPDNIGFGLSDKPAEASYHTLARHIDNLESLVDTLGLRRITLVAHGWGGPIGLGYAVRHPEAIARMVLCCTWALPVADPHHIKQPLKLRIANCGALGRFLDSVLNLSISSAITSRSFRTPSDWTIEAYSYPFPKMASRAAIGAFARMFYQPSEADRATMRQTYESLNRVKAPAQIVLGSSDPLMTRLPAYLLRDALSEAGNPAVVPEASHLVPEDAPEAFAETVLRPEANNKGADMHSDERPVSLFKILS
jgi:pimeloyl-ACP methyl ester carboxylesterase